MALTYPYYNYGSTVSGTSPTPFTVNPQPQYGIPDVYGAVPGPIELPNPAGDLAGQYPRLAGTNAALSGDILAQLQGRLSPGTLKAMQDYEAQFAARSGMPGSNARPGSLMYNRGVRDIGTTAEAQIQAGQRAYNQAIPTISGTQTVAPGLQAEIAATNAVNASAPNPRMAQSYAQQLFNQYMQQLRGPAGGSSSLMSPAGGSASFDYADWRNSMSGGGVTPQVQQPAGGGGLLYDVMSDFNPNDLSGAQSYGQTYGGELPMGTGYDPFTDVMFNMEG